MAPHMVKTQIIRGETVVSGNLPGLNTPESSLSDGGFSPEVKSPSAEHNSLMQVWFEELINKSMKIPDRYQSVTVKLISWCKELDDLQCENEVQELSKLFRESFGFQVERTTLNNTKPPQQQLNAAISNFVLEHDGPYNLLLVYYAGHGQFDEAARQLILAGSNGSNEHSEMHIANATWDTAEKTLMDDVLGDVLVIFDCCYASDIQRNLTHGNKSYEMLAASNRNTPTPRPGPRSFTSDLMKSLKELLQERDRNPFTTYDLLTKITPKRPIGLEPALHNRRFRVDAGLRSRHILIAPHKPQDEARPDALPNPTPDASNLTLTFELGQRSLDREDLDRLTERLPKIFKQAKIPLRRVHWRGLEARTSLRHKVLAIAGMHRFLNRVRKRKSMVEVAAPLSTLVVNIGRKGGTSDEDSKAAVENCPNSTAAALVPRQSQRLRNRKRSG